jgi:hypothetical protein
LQVKWAIAALQLGQIGWVGSFREPKWEPFDQTDWLSLTGAGARRTPEEPAAPAFHLR